MLMPPEIADVRRSVCELSCKEQCAAFKEGKIDYADPSAICPRKGWILKWGCWGRCGDKTVQRPSTMPAAKVSVRVKVARLGRSLLRWVKAGCPVTTKQALEARKAMCAGCEAWRPRGNHGWGECSDYRCGCTKVKRWLATETCPRGKWPEMTVLGHFSRLASALKRLFR